MKWPRRLPPAGTRVSFRDYLATILGAVVQQNPQREFVDQVRAYFDVRSAFLTNSGRSSLVVILKALAERDVRNEILIPAYTCFSVPSAVKKAGLKVRLVDLQEKTFDYDFSRLEKAISPKTLAILLVYPFGLGCDINRAKQIALNHGVYLIEDVAQSMGLKVGGRYAGTFGDVGFFSLSKGKPITAMRGGIIVTNDVPLTRKIADQMKRLPSGGWMQNVRILIEAKVVWFFLRPGLFWVIGKLPFVKLGETHYETTMKVTQMPKSAAILCLRMLPRLESINEARAKAAAAYLARLGKSPRVIPFTGIDPASSRFLRFPVLCVDHAVREQLAERLADMGASRMYRAVLSLIDDPELFADGTPAPGSFPEATQIAERLLTLPTHQYVTPEDIESISHGILASARPDRSSVHVAD